MTTRQLYYLVTISDLGSLSHAAQVLGISQPALSKFLTEYEDSLGFLIFLRHHRHLTPTYIGKYVIECAQKILDEQTHMLQSIRTVADSNCAHIRLATAPNRGAIIYSRIYNEFAQHYPNVSLSLTELYASDQPNAILHGQIDLAIGSGKTSDKVTDLPIAYEELLVSLPASHPLSNTERIHLSDLHDTPFVLQGPRHSIRILAEELFQEAGFQPVIAFESNDVILIDSMLHQAVGAGFVSQAHVFPCKELVYRPLDPPIHQTLHIRYPLGHTLTEPERYLAGLLIRERLSDSRYQPIPSTEMEKLVQLVEQNNSADFHKNSSTQTAIRTHTATEINLNTQLLKYIIAIVDEKSLTQAAEKYYLTQPALSRYLHHVENMLCTQLFTRVHNRLKPTNAGTVFVNFARNILQIEAEMSEYIHAYQTGHGGSIYLQCDPSLTSLLEQYVVERFHALHPNMNLLIVESDKETAQEALLNASADFGLYFSCEKEHAILENRILDEDELLYCSSFDKLPSLSANEFIKQTSSYQIMVATRNSSLRAEQERIIEQNFKQPPAIVCEANIEILQFLAENKIADTILATCRLTDKAISRSHAFQPPEKYYLLFAYHPSRTLPPACTDLANILQDTFQAYFTKNN